MSRPGMDRTEQPPLPENQAKAKHTKKAAKPIISGTNEVGMRTYHTLKPISDVYPAIDNDLARDNVENDLTAADLQDL